MPFQLPGYPSEPPMTLSELHDLALQGPLKSANPKYDEKLKRKEIFDSLEEPVKRAEFDPDLFTRHYFAPDGKPDPSVTEKPLVLKGYKGDMDKLDWAADIPGLKICYKWHECQNEYTVCLGWDGVAVKRAYRNTLAANEVGKEDEQRRKEYKEFVKETEQVRKREKKAQRKTGDELGDISKCVGSYGIRCKELEHRYGAEPRTIDIHNRGPTKSIVIADVNWGIVEGTMLLSFSKKKLDRFVDFTDGIETVTDYASEGDDSEDDDSEECRTSGNTTTLTQQPNKRKAPTFRPRRLHYHLKGRTVDGEMFYQPYKGHFDFDDTYTSFVGNFDTPFTGHGGVMKGCKTDNEPRRYPESWSAFTKATCELERLTEGH